jgi:hypothetical protein
MGGMSDAPSPSRAGLVLSPGPAGRCDEFRVGGAVVDHDPVSGLWRMWYYCRDHEMAGPPPLGSGRVALALSDDGVRWRRVDGAAGRGAVFGPSGVASDFDGLHVGLTDVTRGAGEWLMWYFAGGGEARTSTNPAIGTMRGIGMRPGLARSRDGVIWERVRGQASGGALVDFREDQLYAAWPNVFWDGRRFVMQLSVPSLDIADYETEVHVSDDGVDWKALGPIQWATGRWDWNRGGMVTRQVLQNPLPGGRRWLMVYTGLDAHHKRSICAADSDDGLVWHHLGDGPFFTTGDKGAWDDFGVAANRLVAVGDRLYLYYYGFQTLGDVGLRGIGLATGSDLWDLQRVEASA